jgi:hypothetical protein
MILEQLTILQRHLESEEFDPDFVQMHAQHIADLAKLEEGHQVDPQPSDEKPSR